MPCSATDLADSVFLPRGLMRARAERFDLTRLLCQQGGIGVVHRGPTTRESDAQQPQLP